MRRHHKITSYTNTMCRMHEIAISRKEFVQVQEIACQAKDQIKAIA